MSINNQACHPSCTNTDKLRLSNPYHIIKATSPQTNRSRDSKHLPQSSQQKLPLLPMCRQRASKKNRKSIGARTAQDPCLKAQGTCCLLSKLQLRQLYLRNLYLVDKYRCQVANKYPGPPSTRHHDPMKTRLEGMKPRPKPAKIALGRRLAFAERALGSHISHGQNLFDKGTMQSLHNPLNRSLDPGVLTLAHIRNCAGTVDDVNPALPSIPKPKHDRSIKPQP